MAIEQDIKQSKFRSVYQKLTINLVYTGNWLTHRQLEIFRDYDLTPQQFNVLRILRGHRPDPMTVNAISERMLDKTSNTSRLVDKLLAKRWLQRAVCKSDRRAVDVSITDAGLNKLAKLDPIMNHWEEDLHVLSEEEATLMSKLLDKIRASE